MSRVELPFIGSVYDEPIYRRIQLHGKLVDTPRIERGSLECESSVLPLN